MAKKSTRSLWTEKLNNPTSSLKNSESKQRPPKHTLGNKGRFQGIVLGIDPSLRGTGLAVIEFSSRTKGVLLFSRTVEVDSKVAQTDCFGELFKAVDSVLKSYKITHVAIEGTIYVQNFQTAQIMGASKGALLAAVAIGKLPVSEYAPLRVKQAVVGFGRAGKMQVSKTVSMLLGLKGDLPPDEADACAIALCHAMTSDEL
jgi:crossover junction endodeoxyribonuclease RuvC